jgi:hypothetical protein
MSKIWIESEEFKKRLTEVKATIIYMIYFSSPFDRGFDVDRLLEASSAIDDLLCDIKVAEEDEQDFD